MNRIVLSGLSLVLWMAGCVHRPATKMADDTPTAEVRAVRFLSQEVPLWSKENGCFSCHNNGDGARALYVASASHDIPAAALADTSRWLSAPAQWDSNRGDPGFSDKVLARIQFAAALAASQDAEQAARQIRPSTNPDSTDPLLTAARGLIADQHADGSWQIEGAGTVGSPATYGTALATFMAAQVLQRFSEPDVARAGRRAQEWLQQSKPNDIPHAVAVVWNSRFSDDKRDADEWLDYFRRGQGSDGGWGPYPGARSEAFDTALVLLATAHLQPGQEMKAALRRGREFLLATQQEDGSWEETTRPANSRSYAQRISTTAWATLALIATRSP